MALTPEISVVIPVHNERDDVAELATRLRKALQTSHEIIFVDDGSTDDTWAQLEKLHEPDRVRLIKFRSNFGKAAALMAGFARTRAPIVFTMDGDLQDDPVEIPRFLAKLAEGYDLVSGWKKKRHDPLNKVIASRIFNSIARSLTRVDLHDMNCGFKCYRGEVARSIRVYGDLYRFIPAIVLHEGYRVGEIEVQHHARIHGRSKYGFSRLFKGFFDLVTVLLRTRYADRPAHGFGFVATGCLALAGLAAVAGLFVPGSLLLAGAALFLGFSGVILFAAGWVAEVAVANAAGPGSAPRFNIEQARD